MGPDKPLSKMIPPNSTSTISSDCTIYAGSIFCLQLLTVYTIGSMSVSADWQENLETIIREAGNIFKSLRTLDLKNLNVRDALTLIGLGFTGLKGLYMTWQVYHTVKEFGISRLSKPNLVKKYGEWAGMVLLEYIIHNTLIYVS